MQKTFITIAKNLLPGQACGIKPEAQIARLPDIGYNDINKVLELANSYAVYRHSSDVLSCRNLEEAAKLTVQNVVDFLEKAQGNSEPSIFDQVVMIVLAVNNKFLLEREEDIIDMLEAGENIGFTYDLEFDSIAMTEVVGITEEVFGVQITAAEEENLLSLQDVVGYVEWKLDQTRMV